MEINPSERGAVKKTLEDLGDEPVELKLRRLDAFPNTDGFPDTVLEDLPDLSEAERLIEESYLEDRDRFMIKTGQDPRENDVVFGKAEIRKPSSFVRTPEQEQGGGCQVGRILYQELTQNQQR